MMCDLMYVLLLFLVFLGNFILVIDFGLRFFDFIKLIVVDYIRLYNFGFFY